MVRRLVRGRLAAACRVVVVWAWFAGATTAEAQTPSVGELVRMSEQELDRIYRQGGAATVPSGKIRGTALVRPGSRWNRPLAKAARPLWQGKVFDGDGGGAINRFFGMRVIRGEVYQGESWFDGGPALILDYQRTSRLYAPYRDEIRQIGPGLYLGRMYERTEPRPTQTLYFVLEDRAASR